MLIVNKLNDDNERNDGVIKSEQSENTVYAMRNGEGEVFLFTQDEDFAESLIHIADGVDKSNVIVTGTIEVDNDGMLLEVGRTDGLNEEEMNATIEMLRKDF